MPTRDVGSLQKCWVIFSCEDTVISQYSIYRLKKITMSVKAGVEKRDRDAAAGLSLVGVNPHRDC